MCKFAKLLACETLATSALPIDIVGPYVLTGGVQPVDRMRASTPRVVGFASSIRFRERRSGMKVFKSNSIDAGFNLSLEPVGAVLPAVEADEARVSEAKTDAYPPQLATPMRA